VQKIFTEMANRISTATKGAVHITIYPSETLAKSKDVADATASGLADIGWCMTGTSPGRYPLLDIFNLPVLGFTDAEMASLCANYIAKKYSTELGKELGTGVKLIDFATTGVDVIGTKSKAIRTVADFQGMKLRSSGANPTALQKALGAVPIIMSPGDIYTNVEKGVIDGWCMPWSGTTNFKLYEVSKYYTETRNWVGPLFTMMNQKKFDSMPKEVQEQFMSVMNDEFTIWQSRIRDQANYDAQKYAISKGGEDIEFSAEERTKMQALAQPIWKEYCDPVDAKGLPATAILNDILAFNKNYKPAAK
jgi:TRAP-type C4-dicarboxylate transport system substrate-binding protein